MATSDCPCGSGAPYRACCRPLHRGEREAPDAEALMRSRYAAFALKEVTYLVRTLHGDHPDRGRPEAELLRELRTSASTFRYQGLTVLDRSGPDAAGVARVLFLARIFEKGRDRSFVERSEFAREGASLRYLAGEGLPVAALGADPRSLTLATFGVPR